MKWSKVLLTLIEWSFVTLVLLVVAATGSCKACGFDRDYVGDLIDRRATP
jgi:hypothetical protein